MEALDGKAIEKLAILNEWIDSFLIQPNDNLGREGPVCPFCPKSRAQNRMSFYPFRGQRSYDQLEPILLKLRNLFLEQAVKAGDEAIHQTYILVFPDVTEENYTTLIDDIQRTIKPKFVSKGLMLGEFHPLQESQGIHNPKFRPLRAPVPLLVIRHMTKMDIQFLNTPQYPIEQRIQFMSAYLDTFKSSEVEKMLQEVKAQKNKKTNLLPNEKLRGSQHIGPDTDFFGDKQWTILYGTQTGTASSFATILGKLLASMAKQNDKTIRIVAMDEYNFKSDLAKESTLFVLSSTFGSGDPPGMGVEFKNFLESLGSNQEWAGSFAVFGLGSKLYPQFCKWPMDLDDRLEKLGGNRMIPIHKANELENQQASFQSWAKELIRYLNQSGLRSSRDISQSSVAAQEIWELREEGLGRPRGCRLSTRIDCRSVLEKVVQALNYSHGVGVIGVQAALQTSAALLQRAVSIQDSSIQSTELKSSSSLRSALQQIAKVETKTRTLDLLRVFDALDRNGDGVLSYREFEMGIRQLGISVTHEELARTMQKIDSNADGNLSVEEFLAYMQTESESSLVGRIISTRIKPISRQNPFFATVIGNKELFSAKSARSCRLIKFDISDYGAGTLFFRPGDHLGIYPENNPQQVHEAVRLLRISNADTLFSLKLIDDSLAVAISPPFPTVTYWQALSCYVDLHKPPSASMCRMLSVYCIDETEKETLRVYGKNGPEYEKWLIQESPTIISFLASFPSLHLENNMGAFFEYVPNMQPRWYSICSSLSHYPNEVHICVAHFAYQTSNGDIRKGVCSNWLRSHCPSSVVDRAIALPIFSGASPFHLPDDVSTPVIMMATGTGLAPFRSFWQERNHQIHNQKGDFGPFMMFFGCRYDSEHIFKDELNEYATKNVISHLRVAYSRNTSGEKRRITDDLRADGDLLYELCNEKGAHIYICGDICVAEAIKRCLRDRWDMIDAEQSLLDKMKETGRIHEDIFGNTPNAPRVNELNSENVKGLQ